MKVVQPPTIDVRVTSCRQTTSAPIIGNHSASASYRAPPQAFNDTILTLIVYSRRASWTPKPGDQAPELDASTGPSNAPIVPGQGQATDVHLWEGRFQERPDTTMTMSDTIRLEDLLSESERLARRLSEADDELLELRERLRMVGSSAKVGIWEYDFRTDTLWVSDELAAMYGYSAEEFTWERFVSCLHPDDVVSELKRPTPSFPFGEVNEFIFRFRHADGDFRTIRSRSTTYGSGDTPHRKIGAHIDMSSDTLLHLNSKLAEANERIAQFSRIASHDLRSPLRAIKGLAFLTLHDPDSSLSPSGVEHLERVINRIGHMDRLVCELLEYSSSGLDEVAPTETDVDQVLDDVVQLIDPGDLAIEVDSTVGRVTTTASPLTICVRNMIDNACKHHDRNDGTVRVRARLEDRWLEIVVSDDGPGIPEAHQEKIFEPFYSTNSESGTGLGLAHVKRVVEQYDGSLDLESTPGQGSTFTVRWPVTATGGDRRAPLEPR